MAIANTLESNYWFGAQGNRLWVGQVEGDGAIDVDHEDLIDKQENNRVKVRIMGYHARDRQTLPPKDLPWATVMMPNSAPQWHKSQGTVHGLGIELIVYRRTGIPCFFISLLVSAILHCPK